MALAVPLTAALVVGVVATESPTPVSAASSKITICHRTHSTTNPYRRITVSQNAVQNQGHGGHDLPNGSSNPAVFTSGFTYVSNNKYWGDIIPGGTNGGTAYNGSNSIANNWSTEGQAIFFGSLCQGMSAKQFYDTEIAAGVPAADIIADLNDMKANEDVALLAALGGTFTLGSVSSWEAAVSATSDPATSVAESSATFNGTLTVGSTSTVTGFDWSTSPTLATYTSVAASPSPVTGTTAVTAGLTGLSPGTTYYFRVTGTTNAGSDTEGVLLGAILSFTTTAATTTTTAATTTTTTTPAATTTTTPAASSTTTTAATTTTTTAAATTTTTAANTTTTAASTTTTTAAPGPTTSVSPGPTSATPTPATPTPTTTPTPMTTTTPTPGTPTDPALGAVKGIVWFDRDRDGQFDGNEWLLPGVTVRLAGSGASLSANRRSEAAPVRTAITDANGAYLFESLPAGAYQVTAAVTISGFGYTSDTDGASDWVVGVDVVVNTTKQADFAGLGTGRVIGQVYETGTRDGLPGARISCRWAGYDDVLGTADDIVFRVTAGADGRFDMAGVPYGDYSCDGRDELSGRDSAPAAATVRSPIPVEAPLPLVAAPPGDVLPRTGVDTLGRLTAPMTFIALGGLALVIGRRRNRRAPA